MGTPGRADRIVTVERLIDAPPQEIFDLLADPVRHQSVDGSGMLLGGSRGPGRLSLGAEFSMDMHQSRARYRSSNTVVEFEEGAAIGWRTFGLLRDRPVIGGQIWAYHLTPADGPEPDRLSTLVRHSYDWGAARMAPALRLLGYPRRMARTMPVSLQRLASQVEAD